MPIPSKIKVLLADGNKLFRQGVASLIEKEPDLIMVGEAESGLEVVQKVSDLGPDVVVLDTFLPVMDGISACRRFKQLHPRTEVVFLTASHNEEQMRESFESGARGYLLKDSEFTELVYAVKKAAAGDYFITGPATHDLVAEYVKPLLRDQRPGGIMTRRERELAKLLADGYSTKEAARILTISPKTAETHRASIMKKLNAKNVTDIVKYCIRNHIIEA